MAKPSMLAALATGRIYSGLCSHGLDSYGRYSYGPYSYGRMLAALATGSTINGAAGRNQWSCRAQSVELPGPADGAAR